MFLSGYVFAFVISVAVGFVFSNIILFGSRSTKSPEQIGRSRVVVSISLVLSYLLDREPSLSGAPTPSS